MNHTPSTPQIITVIRCGQQNNHKSYIVSLACTELKSRHRSH